MNEAYFRSLEIKRKDHLLDQENRFENPRSTVDFVYDQNTGMAYIVDYNNQRYQEAKEGDSYSHWNPFSELLAGE